MIPGKRKEFLDTMRSLQSDKMNQKDISRSRVYEDVEDERAFSLICEWETDEDLERYRNGDNFRDFLGALKTLRAEANFTCRPFRGQEGSVSQESKQ